jgi:hypothetical protein
MLPLHVVPGAVQAYPLQQLWPAAPQPPHAPLLQVPGTVPQLPPAAMQVLATQQPPAEQPEPGQQA